MGYLSTGATNPGGFFWQTTAGGSKVCWSSVTNSQVADSYCPKTASASISGKVTGTVGNILGGAWDVFVGAQRDAGYNKAAGANVAPSSGMPGWLMPVALGVVGVGVVLLLTRKKKSSSAPVSNPARRRRRRRRVRRVRRRRR